MFVVKVLRWIGIKRKRFLAFLIGISFLMTMIVGLYLNFQNVRLTNSENQHMSNEKHWGERKQKYDNNKIIVNKIKNAYALTYGQQSKGEQKSSSKLKLGKKPNGIENYFQNKLEALLTIQGNVNNGLTVKISVLHGVNPHNYKLYDEKRAQFSCLDGEKIISMHAVNDDYCDCQDGSDEPGTSACRNGRFYCVKEGIYIPSSRVNDAICDCCDGSDEWKGLAPYGFIKPENPSMRFGPCSSTC